MTQKPTIRGLHVRTISDALKIFHAVRHEILPIIRRRLDAEERRNISPGDVFVWEERGPNAEASGLGIERWTDSIRWGPSRTKDDFLFYHEKQSHDAAEVFSNTSYRRPLIKQTYSVYLEPGRQTKWHLIAYYNQNTLDQLRTVDHFSPLATIHVPDGAYKSARNPKRPARDLMSSLQHSPNQIRDATSHEETAAVAMQGEDNYGVAQLVPLQYLQSIPPRRRHIVDEMALIRLPMSFSLSHAVHRHLSNIRY